MKRRLDLDYAKGIGIILMVLGHSYSKGNGEAVRTWLYAFHMPLFFIVSGILVGMKNEQRAFTEIIRRKTWTLIVPYFLWCSIIAVYLCVMGRRSFVYFLDLMQAIAALQGVSALWFLPCLFLSQMLFMVFQKAHTVHHALGWGMAAAVGLMGLYLHTESETVDVMLRACTGASFIWLGWKASGIYSERYPLWICLMLGVLHIAMTMLNGRVGILERNYGNGILFYVNAMLGTWLTIQAFSLLNARGRTIGFIVWLGKNSIVMLCTTFFVMDFLRLVDYKVFGSILPRFGFAEGLLLCAMVVLLEVPIIWASEHGCWFAFGKKASSN